MLRISFSRIFATFRRRQLDEELDAELEEHLRLLQERFIRNGMTPADAFYAARRQFGGVTQLRDNQRDRRALPLDLLLQDFRHAFRQLVAVKRFTGSAVLTLALGIGASTAVFAVLNSVVLRPLPFHDPDRLLAFASIDRRGTPHPAPLSYPTFFDFRAQNHVFEHLVSYRDDRFTLTGSQQPSIQTGGEIVSWDLFPLLGVSPELGRGFRPEEEKPGTHVVVLSHSLWLSRFGGDPSVLKRHIQINGRPFQVVGVAPAGFHFPIDNPDVELWTTLAEDAVASEFTPLTEQRGARMLDTAGRLKPGVTIEQAHAHMDRIAGALALQFPDENKNVPKTMVMPELERLTGKGRQPLFILFGAVSLVLLIACANVANLLLARSTERAREFTIRTAIGASRSALVRQVLIESLVLGLVGAAAGVLVTLAMLKAILPLAGESIPRLSQAVLPGPLLAFSVLLGILTSVLFSLAPAIQVARTDLAGALKEGAPTIALGQQRFCSLLVIGQIALGLVPLVGAELLISSFMHLAQRDPGFRPDHLLTFEIGLPDSQYNTAAAIAFCDRLRDRLQTIPGVLSVATGSPLPLTGDEMSVSFDIQERPAAAPDRPHSEIAIVTPGYFRALGIALLKGRDFSERDAVTGPRVLVVNQAFAQKFFPGEEVIGKRLEPGATNGKEKEQMREIVGVVADAKQIALSVDPDPIYYFPYKQLSWTMGAVVLRTSIPPIEVTAAAHHILADLDPQVPMYRIRSGQDLSSTAIARPRFQMVLMGTFAAVALVLTIGGLYGVLSYTVARRRREIGVRIALGARYREVLAPILREALQLVVAGLLLGVVGAIFASHLLTSMVYGIQPGDPAFVVTACCVIVVTGLAAAYIPASRAASVDPMQALRTD